MSAIACATAITRYQINISVQAPQYGMGRMVTTRVKRFTKPAFKLQSSRALGSTEQLQTITGNHVEMIAVDQQSLRTTPGDRGTVRNRLLGVKNTVAIGIGEPAHRLAVTNQQPAAAIEQKVIRASRQLRLGSAIDMKPGRQRELVIKQYRFDRPYRTGTQQWGQAQGEQATHGLSIILPQQILSHRCEDTFRDANLNMCRPREGVRLLSSATTASGAENTGTGRSADNGLRVPGDEPCPAAKTCAAITQAVGSATTDLSNSTRNAACRWQIAGLVY